MATILNGLPAPTSRGDELRGRMMTPKDWADLERAPKRTQGTRVTVRSYPVKLGPIPLAGREHMYTEYDDGQDQYIFRGGPSLHGLHAQVTPARESPDYGRGKRVVRETWIPDATAAEAVWPARRTAGRIERSGAPYGVLISNSNSAVGDQMEDQFGYRVGDGRTPGWKGRTPVPTHMPSGQPYGRLPMLDR